MKALLISLALIATTSQASVTFSGPRDQTRQAFNDAVGPQALLESFESFSANDQVGDMPNNPARFAAEYADGNPAPLPVIQGFAGAPSGSRWMANFGNGRPAGSAWVIRPDNPDDLIYAFGQVNAQGDWVRIEGFDENDQLIISVDAQPIVAGCFAGFITEDGCAKVVVTPIGNFDMLNGMDDVQVSVTPIDPCDPDINCDGELDFFDISAFLEAYQAQNPVADFAPDGLFDFFDISAFLAQYQTGCP